MKWIFAVLTLVAVFNLGANAQCNVHSKYNPSDRVTTYSFQPEELYFNKESGRGILGYDLNFVMFEFGDREQLRLVISSISVSRDNPVLPRKISFFSKEMESLSLIASDYTNLESNRAEETYVYQFYYNIGEKEMEYLLQKKISRVVAYDEREKKSITISPFEKLFSNQLKCVMDEWYNNSYLKRKNN